MNTNGDGPGNTARRRGINTWHITRDGKTRSFEQLVHWNRIPIWWKKESSSHALLPLLTFSDDNGALSHTIKLLKVQNTCSLLLIVDSAMETHV